jgi:hypothetical protein
MMATAAVAISPRWVRRMAGVERSRPVYALAAAGTRASGIVMRAPLLNRAGGGLVGKRTVTLPERALAAARG